MSNGIPGFLSGKAGLGLWPFSSIFDFVLTFIVVDIQIFHDLSIAKLVLVFLCSAKNS
jgi:hypothetical protein